MHHSYPMRLKEMSSDFWGTVFTQVAKIAVQKTTNSLSAAPNADRIHIIDASTHHPLH